ncbi:porin OmpL1 [Leptospira idonii]|uniref:Porin OmpL1 n=2 Tax=Leptospira idonii TaxID=1193500 RepID=A0A4R9M6A1_9LEPT|nr:porin OmpL1 [Leptospira idonii]
MLHSLRLGMMGALFVAMAGSLSAQTGPRSYVVFGIGGQFDLAQMGGTILKDGLDSRQPSRDSQGNITGTPQKAIYSENTLIGLNRSTNGLVGVKDNGAMVGLNLNLGYEKEGLFGINSLFWRINVNYTTKIAGGYTTSTIAGYKWLEQEWNYTAWTIPAYVGVKLFNAANDTAVYVAGGVNYYRGGWGVAGTIDGDTLKNALPGLAGPGGAFLSDAPSPGIYKENAQFRASGFGLNWLIGAQTKVTDKGHVFFELETILSAGMGTAGTRSVGGANALAPIAAYPVVIGGQTYRVGYKLEL